MNNLHPVVEAVVAVLLVIGGIFVLAGAIGLVRFPDFYMRLHAPTKASTLGVGGLVLASVVARFAAGEWALRELLIGGLLVLTAPVSAQLLAQAALHLKARSTAAEPAVRLPDPD